VLRSRATSFAASEEATIDFEAKNEYGVRDNSASHEYPFLTAGKFAEPFRITTLTATATVDDLDLETCSWKLKQALLDETADPAGGYYPAGLPDEYRSFDAMGEIEVEFQAPGTYMVDLTCTDTDSNSHVASSTVDVYYVRREVRDLTDTDRERYLDTFLLMSKVSGEDGREKYGAHYHDMDYFVSMHLNTAGARSHDHIHDGLGVITQHVALTQSLECAMQAVHPSITVPYWDYTIDSYESKLYHGGVDGSMFRDSELWGPKWFGNTSTDKHHITDGRWAYQKISMFNSSDPDAHHSPYGYMRAPWNLNPSPFVTRYHKLCGVGPELMYIGDLKSLTDYKWPTCAVHWKLTFGEHTWYDWVWDSSYLPHGPVHSWIGGVGGGGSDGGCDKAFDEMTATNIMDKNSTTKLKMNMFGLLKNAWRNYDVEMPKYCSLDSGDDCAFKCTFDSDGTMVEAMESMLSTYEISYDHLSSKEMKDIAEEMYCNHKYWPGDHLEAASPVEASFWPIHPTLDRLLQYKESVQPFTSTTWTGDDDGEACTTGGSKCKGHNQYDLTFWKASTQDSSTGLYNHNYHTNEEMRVSLNQDTYAMSYVYDSFTWDHCSEEGYDFSGGKNSD